MLICETNIDFEIESNTPSDWLLEKLKKEIRTDNYYIVNSLTKPYRHCHIFETKEYLRLISNTNLERSFSSNEVVKIFSVMAAVLIIMPKNGYLKDRLCRPPVDAVHNG